MIIVFFFFQAEDGIRDTSVTGVQTCALPILTPRGEVGLIVALSALNAEVIRDTLFSVIVVVMVLVSVLRSEERRVGKECSCRCGACVVRSEEERGCRGSRAMERRSGSARMVV